MKAEIKLASSKDIEKIIEVCEANLLQNNREKFSANDFSNKGFLMGRLVFDDVQNMINDPKNYLVLAAKNGDEVLGYLTGCDLAKMDENFQREITKLVFDEKIFYHKQIAKKSDAKKIGENLLLKMFDEVAKKGYSTVVCKIVHQPFENKISISFHEKFGFKFLGEVQEDSRVVGIYLKNL